MGNYISDANLIKGAAAAYKNWENVPGIYAGLDKLSKAGKELTQEVMLRNEAEKLKAEKAEKEAKEKKKAQDDAWYDVAGKVYENAGSFQGDVEYKDTVAQLEELRGELEAAEESGNAEDKAAVMIKFNNIKAEVEEHKVFRDTITDPEYGLSAAMDNSGVKGGDDGRDKEFLTELMKENYTVSRNEKGEKVYTVGGITVGGVAKGGVSKTMKEINAMAIVKDNIPFTTYSQQLSKGVKATSFSRENTEYDIRNNVIPKDINKLRAFLSDKGFGNGKNFEMLLNDPKNKKAIMKEIDTTLFDKGAIVDGKLVGADDGIISDAEYKEFVLAITDPYHETWKGDDGIHDKNAWQEQASRIATEQLANGIENGWVALHPDDTDDGSTPTWQQLQNLKQKQALQPKVQEAINTNNFNSVNTKARSVKIQDGNYILIRDGVNSEFIDMNEKNAKQAVMNWFLDSTEYMYEKGKNADFKFYEW